MVKKNTTIKIYPAGKARGTRGKKLPQKPVIRNKNFGQIQNAIISNIKVSTLQRELEESIKNCDFSKYDELLKQKGLQDERLKLDKILNAITLLKQGFNEARMDIQQFDPNNPLVDEVEKESDKLLLTLNKQFEEIIRMRPRIKTLTADEKRRLGTLDRDIERYSDNLNKVKSLVEQLAGKEKKLKPDEVTAIKERKEAEKSFGDIAKALKDVAKFGFNNTTQKDQDILKKALEKAEKL